MLVICVFLVKGAHGKLDFNFFGTLHAALKKAFSSFLARFF
jgi:hypothetical protein